MIIAVIGAGAAGVIAAGVASSAKHKVILLDKNDKICKKLFITGKGRCNITNDCTADEFIENVVTNPRFLYSAVKAFPPQNTISFFNGLGCMLKTERGNRVFPSSDKSSDIITALRKFLSNNNVNMMLSTECKDIVKNSEGFIIHTNKGIIKADKVIIAAGGASYPATGSNGQIFSIIEKLGHAVTELKPALCAVIVKENVSELAGLSLKNVRIQAICGGKKVYGDMGEMLFTHNGLSGPLILSASSYINKYDINKGVQISIDLKPALDLDTLISRINRDFLQLKNKLFKNSLNELLPKSLIPFIIKTSQIPPEIQVNSITAEKRRVLASLLKNLTFNVSGLAGIEGAIVTSGGVCVKQINPSSMESKIISGLYFAGEVIDVDALTGGFNLQAAISTGYLAGKSASV